MPLFALQFPIQRVPGYAARYPEEDNEILALGRAARDRGYYTREAFVRVCRWKTPRSSPLVAQNTAESVEGSTRVALATDSSEPSGWRRYCRCEASVGRLPPSSCTSPTEIVTRFSTSARSTHSE
jgi:hypothetical protein